MFLVAQPDKAKLDYIDQWSIHNLFDISTTRQFGSI